MSTGRGKVTIHVGSETIETTAEALGLVLNMAGQMTEDMHDYYGPRGINIPKARRDAALHLLQHLRIAVGGQTSGAS